MDERQSDPAVRAAVASFAALRTYQTDAPMLAAPAERVMARLVDLVGAAIVFVVVVSGWLLLFGDDAQYAADVRAGVANHDSQVAALLGAAAVVVFMLANDGWATTTFGQTLGKRLFGLRVVDARGGPPTGGATCIRLCVWALPVGGAATAWFATFPTTAGLLFMVLLFAALAIPGKLIRDERHRGLHDIAAGTIVVTPRAGHVEPGEDTA